MCAKLTEVIFKYKHVYLTMMQLMFGNYVINCNQLKLQEYITYLQTELTVLFNK